MKLTGTQLRIIRAAIEIAEAENRSIILPPGVMTLTALVDMVDDMGAEIARLRAENDRMSLILANGDVELV